MFTAGDFNRRQLTSGVVMDTRGHRVVVLVVIVVCVGGVPLLRRSPPLTPNRLQASLFPPYPWHGVNWSSEDKSVVWMDDFSGDGPTEEFTNHHRSKKTSAIETYYHTPDPERFSSSYSLDFSIDTLTSYSDSNYDENDVVRSSVSFDGPSSLLNTLIFRPTISSAPEEHTPTPTIYTTDLSENLFNSYRWSTYKIDSRSRESREVDQSKGSTNVFTTYIVTAISATHMYVTDGTLPETLSYVSDLIIHTMSYSNSEDPDYTDSSTSQFSNSHKSSGRDDINVHSWIQTSSIFEVVEDPEAIFTDSTMLRSSFPSSFLTVADYSFVSKPSRTFHISKLSSTSDVKITKTLLFSEIRESILSPVIDSQRTRRIESYLSESSFEDDVEVETLSFTDQTRTITRSDFELTNQVSMTLIESTPSLTISLRSSSIDFLSTATISSVNDEIQNATDIHITSHLDSDLSFESLNYNSSEDLTLKLALSTNDETYVHFEPSTTSEFKFITRNIDKTSSFLGDSTEVLLESEYILTPDITDILSTPDIAFSDSDSLYLEDGFSENLTPSGTDNYLTTGTDTILLYDIESNYSNALESYTTKIYRSLITRDLSSKIFVTDILDSSNSLDISNTHVSIQSTEEIKEKYFSTNDVSSKHTITPSVSSTLDLVTETCHQNTFCHMSPSLTDMESMLFSFENTLLKSSIIVFPSFDDTSKHHITVRSEPTYDSELIIIPTHSESELQPFSSSSKSEIIEPSYSSEDLTIFPHVISSIVKDNITTFFTNILDSLKTSVPIASRSSTFSIFTNLQTPSERNLSEIPTYPSIFREISSEDIDFKTSFTLNPNVTQSFIKSSISSHQKLEEEETITYTHSTTNLEESSHWDILPTSSEFIFNTKHPVSSSTITDIEYPYSSYYSDSEPVIEYPYSSYYSDFEPVIEPISISLQPEKTLDLTRSGRALESSPSFEVPLQSSLIFSDSNVLPNTVQSFDSHFTNFPEFVLTSTNPFTERTITSQDLITKSLESVKISEDSVTQRTESHIEGKHLISSSEESVITSEDLVTTSAEISFKNESSIIEKTKTAATSEDLIVKTMEQHTTSEDFTVEATEHPSSTEMLIFKTTEHPIVSEDLKITTTEHPIVSEDLKITTTEHITSSEDITFSKTGHVISSENLSSKISESGITITDLVTEITKSLNPEFSIVVTDNKSTHIKSSSAIISTTPSRSFIVPEPTKVLSSLQIQPLLSVTSSHTELTPSFEKPLQTSIVQSTYISRPKDLQTSIFSSKDEPLISGKSMFPKSSLSGLHLHSLTAFTGISITALSSKMEKPDLSSPLFSPNSFEISHQIATSLFPAVSSKSDSSDLLPVLHIKSLTTLPSTYFTRQYSQTTSEEYKDNTPVLTHLSSFLKSQTYNWSNSLTLSNNMRSDFSSSTYQIVSSQHKRESSLSHVMFTTPMIYSEYNTPILSHGKSEYSSIISTKHLSDFTSADLTSYPRMTQSSYFTSAVLSSQSLPTGLDETTPATVPNVDNSPLKDKNYWILTVVEAPLKHELPENFSHTVELRLANAYSDAFKSYRSKRDDSSLNRLEFVIVKILSLTNNMLLNQLEMVYVVERGGEFVPASSAAATLNVLRDDQLRGYLGYNVIVKATPYQPEKRSTIIKHTPATSTSVIIGSIIGALLSILLILCIYCRCCRSKTVIASAHSSASGSLQRSLSTYGQHNRKQIFQETTHYVATEGEAHGEKGQIGPPLKSISSSVPIAGRHLPKLPQIRPEQPPLPQKQNRARKKSHKVDAGTLTVPVEMDGSQKESKTNGKSKTIATNLETTSNEKPEQCLNGFASNKPKYDSKPSSEDVVNSDSSPLSTSNGSSSPTSTKTDTESASDRSDAALLPKANSRVETQDSSKAEAEINATQLHLARVRQRISDLLDDAFAMAGAQRVGSSLRNKKVNPGTDMFPRFSSLRSPQRAQSEMAQRYALNESNGLLDSTYRPLSTGGPQQLLGALTDDGKLEILPMPKTVWSKGSSGDETTEGKSPDSGVINTRVSSGRSCRESLRTQSATFRPSSSLPVLDVLDEVGAAFTAPRTLQGASSDQNLAQTSRMNPAALDQYDEIDVINAMKDGEPIAAIIQAIKDELQKFNNSLPGLNNESSA